MLCGSLDGRGVWGRMDTCTYMAESLCCPPENYHNTVNHLYSKIKLKVVCVCVFSKYPLYLVK